MDIPHLYLRAIDLRTSQIVPYIPTGVQRRFHESPAKYRGFVSSIGSGKTTACCAETLDSAILFPGSYHAVLRWNQSSLRDTTFAEIERLIANSELDCLIKDFSNTKANSHIELTNGSVIQGYHSKDWNRFGSLPLSSFFIDEVQEVEEPDVFNHLCTRVSRHKVGPNRGWVSGLPDGHNWYYEKFVARNHPNYAHFQATSFANPFLKEGYVEELIEIHGKELAQMLVLGSFDSVEGRLFSSFDPKLHVLRKQQLPHPWPRYCGVDPGFGCDPDKSTDRANQGDPCAALRVVVDPFGNWIVEAEYQRFDRLTEQFTEDILKLNEALPPRFYTLDKSAFAADHRARFTVAEVARRGGMTPLLEAKNTAGYLQHAVPRLRSMLTPQPGRIHPLTHEEGCFPSLYFFEDCIKTIHQVQTLRRKRQGVAGAKDEIKLPDHGHDLMDALFFLSLESLEPAEKETPALDLRRWYTTNQLLPDEEPPEPYLHQISRLRR